ncbi:MAG: hypothetical protein M9964_09495 [Solirubrobacterales bacterium]|nr:hypothetical protein [Solirubrobacterales bacterium]
MSRGALKPALIAAAAAGLLVLLYRRLVRTTVSTERGRVEILEPEDTVRVESSGAVGSVQEAEITVEREVLERIWTADSLELLARGYWAFLRRFTLGIVRVVYAHEHRTVTAFGRIPLLRFGAPRYETEDGSGRVTWPIDEGLLVAREGRGKGHLRVAVQRCDRDGVDDEEDAKLDRVRIIARVEVQNFYPGLRGRGAFARFGAWFYAQTQLRIHVIVCNAYLLSLPTLDFPDLDTTSMPSEREPEPSAA